MKPHELAEFIATNWRAGKPSKEVKDARQILNDLVDPESARELIVQARRGG